MQRMHNANAPTRRQLVGGAAFVLGFAASASGADEISQTAEAIHQEPLFQASRKRVYQALTDPAQFSRIVVLSGAMQSMKLSDKPAEISPNAGGAFSLFGGYITGRHIELVPGERIVQAWRSASWEPGAYSIARFDLREEGAATRIVFDHRGFPDGQGKHLAAGWHANYWEPLRKLLA